MSDDSRCCGTGTCIINAEGLCWCGQRWDGEKMCFMPEPAVQPECLAQSGIPSQLPRVGQVQLVRAGFGDDAGDTGRLAG